MYRFPNGIHFFITASREISMNSGDDVAARIDTIRKAFEDRRRMKQTNMNSADAASSASQPQGQELNFNNFGQFDNFPNFTDFGQFFDFPNASS
jgi:hypothetical protein